MNELEMVAYFLSEYDQKAFSALGYSSRAAGFEGIASLFGKKASYLRRLRDEYDVLTSSTRHGQCNRPPREKIVKITNCLRDLSFDELCCRVKKAINRLSIEIEKDLGGSPLELDDEMTEEEMEFIVNFKDVKAGVKESCAVKKTRVYDPSIITELKRLYHGKCQICGNAPFACDISEVHHIKYFSEFHNNDSSNLIVLCPNHHRLIHKCNPSFDYANKEFVFDSGEIMKIQLDYHLSDDKGGKGGI